MGLAVSFDCWEGPYSSFNRWRTGLARAAGYAVAPLGGGELHPVVDWGHVDQARMQGEWDRVPCTIVGEPDPLLILLTHADNEGRIKAEHCGPLADRLDELVSVLPVEHDPELGGSWQGVTRQFIVGLRDAVEEGEDVEFE
ncbi:hypothetical protein [Haloechinothrix sp. LS1_15]|uniref:hypothetical protein n=1 Tax=Haloechinothrix sp. LS1_15 TaxID=2652248 RepID=UPI0029458C3B|nr:hypothetical protein [Haloechinothrix sp. LS1_15]MDV6014394.1 hypothetical protein [Haloechinothrix sp. LS1_15]